VSAAAADPTPYKKSATSTIEKVDFEDLGFMNHLFRWPLITQELDNLSLFR
jgi:hypothetical protein